jgi:hypothetical protein
VKVHAPARKPEVGWWRRFFACCSERDAIALAVALPRCRLLTCDAFIADVVRRSRLDTRFRCELFRGRRADVDKLGCRSTLCSRRGRIVRLGRERATVFRREFEEEDDDG